MAPRSLLLSLLACGAVLGSATAARSQGQPAPPLGQQPPGPPDAGQPAPLPAQPAPPPGWQPAPQQPGQPYPPGAQPGYPPGYPPPPAGMQPGYPPPGYGWGPPPGYYPPPYYYQPALSPRTMPYKEGDAVPPGYRVEDRARRGLVIAGAVTFGSAYLISVLGASAAVSDGGRESEQFGALFIPVAGPFVTIGTAGDDASGAVPIFILDGIAQIGGVVMFIAGMAATQTLLVREDVASTPILRPDVAVGPRGASASWRF